MPAKECLAVMASVVMRCQGLYVSKGCSLGIEASAREGGVEKGRDSCETTNSSKRILRGWQSRLEEFAVGMQKSLLNSRGNRAKPKAEKTRYDSQLPIPSPCSACFIKQDFPRPVVHPPPARAYYVDVYMRSWARSLRAVSRDRTLFPFLISHLSVYRRCQMLQLLSSS